MASVSLRRLAKRYDPTGKAVLDDVSLEVHDGELFVLLGPSGSGKTTVLRCVAGLEQPSAGEILIGERDVTRLDPAARNIAFGLEVRHVAPADVERRVQQAADRLGLGAVLDRRPGELSGGERQRAALGRALVREPHVFLFDEPLSNLDPTMRGELRAELVELHRTLGATMIYVTHDQVEAMAIAQRIGLLAAGRLRQVGTPAELYAQPADVFVARFLGSPGMNVLKGTGRGGGGGGGGEGRARDGEGAVDVGVWSVPVPLERYEGEIHLGVRPEHVALVAPDRGIGAALVQSVEPLGAETLVRVDVGGQALVARVPGPSELRRGDRVGVKLDRRQLHLFDAAGARLQ